MGVVAKLSDSDVKTGNPEREMDSLNAGPPTAVARNQLGTEGGAALAALPGSTLQPNPLTPALLNRPPLIELPVTNDDANAASKIDGGSGKSCSRSGDFSLCSGCENAPLTLCPDDIDMELTSVWCEEGCGCGGR